MRCVIAAALGAAALIALAATRARTKATTTARASRRKRDAAPRGGALRTRSNSLRSRRAGTLVLYLDRFATNEPVRGAKIEVETPDGPVAAAAADGVYRIKAPWLGKPGHIDLIVTVTAGDDTDVLPLTHRHAGSQRSDGRRVGWMSGLDGAPAAGDRFGVGFGVLLGIALMSFGGAQARGRAAARRGALPRQAIGAGGTMTAADADIGPTAPRARPTARCSCRSRSSAFSDCARRSRSRLASALDRTAGPDHSRS